MFSYSTYKKMLILLIGFVVLIGLVLLVVPRFFSPATAPSTTGTPSPMLSVPPGEEVVIKGKLLCLPHKDTSGPQTLECAYGILDQEGTYYALQDTDPTYKNIAGAPMNTNVVVSGTFTPKENTTYPSIGIIEVTSISR